MQSELSSFAKDFYCVLYFMLNKYNESSEGIRGQVDNLISPSTLSCVYSAPTDRPGTNERDEDAEEVDDDDVVIAN